MNVLQSIVLGIIQGLTEFLPISSSGHLVIVPYFLGWEFQKNEVFIFDVLVQVATLIAVFAYFWKDVVDIIASMLDGLLKRSPFETEQARLGWYLVLATIPAGLFGFGLKNLVARAFSSPIAVGVFLLVTAALLVVAERVGKKFRKINQIRWMDSIWIGFFQVLAVFPGVSRSGATIAGGMTRDLERPAAARFAFLISIPIMLAAGIVAGYDLAQVPHTYELLLTYIPGFVSAAVVGYISIRWLLRYLVSHSLDIFAVYCTAAGLLVIAVYYFRK